MTIRRRWQRLLTMAAVGLATGNVLRAEFSLQLDLNCSTDPHELSWETRPGFTYELEASTDLALWQDTGVIFGGDGGIACYSFPTLEPKAFFRLQERVDPYEGAFLVMPAEASEIDQTDGVCFSFDLSVFPEMPEKIHLYRRDAGSDTWQIIGTLTDFAEIEGIRFPRGNAIWIPEETGSFEVQAVAKDFTGEVLGSAARSIEITLNPPPDIAITGGPPTTSETSVLAEFSTIVTDPEDEIAWVEFFDNGERIGIDRSSPFGNDIVSETGRTFSLLRGVHHITARAHDERGAVGETATPYTVTITGGNARPELEIVSPVQRLFLNEGDPLVVEYTVTDPDGPADVIRVSLVGINGMNVAADFDAPFEALTVPTTGWGTGSHLLRVIATDAGGATSYLREIEVYISDPATGNLAEQWTANITDGISATPSNALFTGVEASSDSFEEGLLSGLEIDSGIILTSGLSRFWNGGDTTEAAGEHMDIFFNNQQEPGDEVLERLVAGFRTFDAASLEFDVFVTDGHLEIEYQFGSEEYDEWVQSYNDAFVISINGVIASFVPDCSDIVSVNSVNQIWANENSPPPNEHLFLDDDDDILPSVAPEHRPTRVEYDGMVRRLRLNAFVTPNQIHRVKMVIADVDDDRYDSALIIGENSVRSLPVFR